MHVGVLRGTTPRMGNILDDLGRRARHETKIAGTLFLERQPLRMAGLPLDGLAAS